MKPTIFLSYSRKDLDQMIHVKDSLMVRGINVWTDELLQPGTPQWENDIATSIENSQAFIVLLSPHAKQSVWVNRELSYAEEHGVRIFPLLIDGDEKTAVPLRLVSTQRIDMRNGFTSGIRQLIDALNIFSDLHIAEKSTMSAEELSEFLANSAHDMKSPLGTLNTSISMLLRYRDKLTEERIEKLLLRCQKSIEYLRSTIDDIQTLSRLDRNILHKPSVTVNAVDVAHSVYEESIALGEEKGLSISFQANSDTLRVLIDETQLYRALSNITSNAINYTLPGGSVTILLYEEDEKLFIVVEDTGIGIPEKDRENVFKRFFRSNNAMVSQSGTGLGLAISKEIIEHYGGSIWFESKLEQGTKFYISLPLST